jgi:hypothetical protein
MANYFLSLKGSKQKRTWTYRGKGRSQDNLILWDFRFWRRRVRRWQPYGIQRRVVSLKQTDVSEVRTASIIRALYPRRLSPPTYYCFADYTLFLTLGFPRLEFKVKFKLSGFSSAECWNLSDVSVNTAVAIFTRRKTNYRNASLKRWR